MKTIYPMIGYKHIKFTALRCHLPTFHLLLSPFLLFLEKRMSINLKQVIWDTPTFQAVLVLSSVSINLK